MKLWDRLLLLVAVVLISASLFAGLAVVVENFSSAPMRPTASIGSPWM